MTNTIFRDRNLSMKMFKDSLPIFKIINKRLTFLQNMVMLYILGNSTPIKYFFCIYKHTDVFKPYELKVISYKEAINLDYFFVISSFVEMFTCFHVCPICPKSIHASGRPREWPTTIMNSRIPSVHQKG